jgi:hypothetical protein
VTASTQNVQGRHLTRPQVPHWRVRAGVVLAVLLGIAFVVIGLILATSSDPARDASFLAWRRLFGLRDAFLGALVLALLALNERRSLFWLLAGSIVLPVADSIALAGLVGWHAALASNLPFEIPLVLIAWLLSSYRRLGAHLNARPAATT